MLLRVLLIAPLFDVTESLFEDFFTDGFLKINLRKLRSTHDADRWPVCWPVIDSETVTSM